MCISQGSSLKQNQEDIYAYIGIVIGTDIDICKYTQVPEFLNECGRLKTQKSQYCNLQETQEEQMLRSHASRRPMSQLENSWI